MRNIITLILSLIISTSAYSSNPTDSIRTYQKKQPLSALFDVVAIDGAVLAWDALLFDNRDWAKVSKQSIKDNFHSGWEWDDDSFSGNQFSHPYHGSLFYNSAREHGLNYGQSMVYPLIGSTIWEIFCENNRPSINDFFSTGIGGTAIGEALYRSSDLLYDNSKTGAKRVFSEMVGSILNPVRGIHRLLNGEMFRVDHNQRGKRLETLDYQFEIGVGNRYVAELGDPHPEYGRKYVQNLPMVDFFLDYGEHFNSLDGGKTVPFDQFSLYAQLNLGKNEPTFGNVEINGRIFSTQHTAKHNWTLDWGIYQNFKYIDSYWKGGQMRSGNLPTFSEAASFGGGLYAEHEGKSKLKGLLMLSAVPMGCSTADYYTSPNLFKITELPGEKSIGKRRYNYGMGFSVRKNIEWIISNHFSIGERSYYLNLHTFSGYDPQHVVEHHNGVMGDKGHQEVFTDTFYANYNLSKSLKFKLEYEVYERKGVYDYYPNLKGKSHEVKTTLTYSI